MKSVSRRMSCLFSLPSYSNLLLGILTLFTIVPGIPVWPQDLGGWKQVSVSGPGARSAGGMIYDSKREKVILYGGWIGNYYTGDIWGWDGTAWNLIYKNNNGRGFFPLVYDKERDKIVLFGGSTGNNNAYGDTWEWDGTQWSKKAPSRAPKPLNGHAMAYNEFNKKVLLYGGWNGSTYFGETWEWDGINWSNLNVNGPYPPRKGHAMTYDSDRNKIVLFGGGDDYKVLNDTWEWDGNTWTLITPAVSPKPRQKFSLVYDRNRKKTVLFGGCNLDGTEYYGDTWEWDGINWNLVSNTGPGWRYNSQAAYDEKRGKIVLFGGDQNQKLNFGYSLLNDTWEYSAPQLPPADKTYTFDSADEYTRISGGFNSAPGGNLELGAIPAWSGYSDGKGVKITVGKNQVELLLFPALDVGDNMVLLRASVQSDNIGASIALGALDGSLDGSIATNQPAKSDFYQGNYKRIVVAYDPPGKTVAPAFQVANPGAYVLPVTVYLDNIEIFILPRYQYRLFYGE